MREKRHGSAVDKRIREPWAISQHLACRKLCNDHVWQVMISPVINCRHDATAVVSVEGCGVVHTLRCLTLLAQLRMHTADR